MCAAAQMSYYSLHFVLDCAHAERYHFVYISAFLSPSLSVKYIPHSFCYGPKGGLTDYNL